MSFYITLPSNVTNNENDDNRVSHYNTYLQRPLLLYGPWEVAIVKIIYTNTLEQSANQNNEIFYFYTDFIEEQILGDTRAQLLDVIGNTGTENSMVTVQFTNPHYVTCSKSIIRSIWLGTRDSVGEYIKFRTNSRLIVKLHFRPKLV